MRMHCRLLVVILLLTLAAPGAVQADDEFTLYELLDPDTHRFAITFDVTTSRAGATTYLNGVRAGSEIYDERVIDRATGQELSWELITGADAKARGLRPDRIPDESRFLAVQLPRPVPEGGEARLRIVKIYADPASYWRDGDTIHFKRDLGIRANAVILPQGYELLASSVPSLASGLPDGRTKVSFLNDRDDALGVHIVARRLAVTAPESRTDPGSEASGSALNDSGASMTHRAEQDREITYWLNPPRSHSFRISHDFTVDTPGQRYVHNFVRTGSEVRDSSFFDLDTGARLPAETLTGRQVNEAGSYSRQLEDDAVVVQAELSEAVAPGHSARVRVVETYTDAERYYLDGEELVWDRTLGRPRNVVTLPAGWMLVSISTPAVIFVDTEGRTALRFINPRNDSVHVVLRARRRPEPH